MKNINQVSKGEMVDPASLSAEVLRNGGGWVKVEFGPANNRSFRAVYVCKGAHKDGSWGWQCTEIR